MINLSSTRQALSITSRKYKRQQAISLKRKITTLSFPSDNYNYDLPNILSTINQNQKQAYASLSSISNLLQVSTVLISQTESDTLFNIINGLQSTNHTIVLSCLTILGNISYNHSVETLMDYDIVSSLIPNVSHQKQAIRELSIWILGNIAGEQQSYATSLLNNTKLIELLEKKLINDRSKVRTQILYFFRNLIQKAQRKRLVQYLSQDDLFVAIRSVIKEQSKQFQQLSGEVIQMIIFLGDEMARGDVNLLKIKIQKLGILSVLQGMNLIDQNMEQENQI